ncbi:shikimate kinase AroK [Neisseria sp. Ec49-e6-T10]|uniref:shikimate kinase AroK n=1 Tax=Neisseria sp. Ec49-e6-T10 TaxID=3140744 RepID=UPI003EB710DC
MPAMINMAGNFFLIGLMGAGKTTVGRQLAFRLGKDFYDSDHEIVARTGVPVTTIFEIEGEERFRAREAQMIAELTQKQNIVLATGGGVILREDNRRALAQNGTVIYLRSSIDAILERTRYDRTRPLLQTENPRAKLEALFKQRDPLYQEIADITIDASELFFSTLMRNLLLTIEQYPSS